MLKRVLLLSALAFLADGQQVLSTRTYFYAGGKYTGPPGNEVLSGQMYVEKLQPRRVSQRYPMVLIHGNWQTSTNWMQTPDGRPGWADYFLERGYVVYLADQPARGRSPWHASTNGRIQGHPASFVEQRFTAPELSKLWPQAVKHTQWPGEGERKGRQSDPLFDAFYATQFESLESGVETQNLILAAGTALLDTIGPAIILTHSQSGSFGWILADARPQAVKGIIAVEPSGPPFRNAVFDEEKSRAWGIADIPLTYDPPAKTAPEIAITQQPTPDGPDL